MFTLPDDPPDPARAGMPRAEILARSRLAEQAQATANLLSQVESGCLHTTKKVLEKYSPTRVSSKSVDPAMDHVSCVLGTMVKQPTPTPMSNGDILTLDNRPRNRFESH